MGFFNAFGYKFFIKSGTSSSTAPAASTGMVEVKNLSNAGISSSTDTQEVITYDTTTNGWKQQIVTANSYTISCELNIDTKDAGYQLLKEAARDSATGKMVEWYRETPLATAAAVPGPVATLTVGNGSSGITATGAALTGVATTSGGSGTGLTVDVTVVGGAVTAAVINAAGTGYSVGDAITIAAASLAGAAGNVTLSVASVSGGGAAGTAEKHAGVAAVGNFSEDIQAGNVAKCTFDLVGYGPYVLTKAS